MNNTKCIKMSKNVLKMNITTLPLIVRLIKLLNIFLQKYFTQSKCVVQRRGMNGAAHCFILNGGSQ